MQKRTSLALLICLWLAAVSCEITIPGGSVSTLVSEAEAVASKVAEAQTQTAGSHGAAPSATETGPSGGGPSATDTETPVPTQALTPTPTVTATPSPPHLRVAFISGGSPWMVEPPAAAFQLSAFTGVDSVHISDDGQRVAYVRHNDYSSPAELRVVHSDGTNDHTLLTSAQVGGLETPPGGALFVDLFQVKWIPGTHDLFISTKADFEGPGLARFDDLFRLNADTGAITTILTAGNAGEVWPSPDAAKMVISRATAISLANIDGTGRMSDIITFPAIITYSEYQYYPEPVWAHDSASFGVIIASEDPFAPSPTGSIWLVNAATGAATLASTLNGNFFFPKAVLSPTLDHVGYVTNPVSPSVNESYVSTLDGSFGLHLGSGTTGVDSFAPDGQHFAYYVGAPVTKYIGSLGGGTILVPGGAMRIRWFNDTEFVYAAGTVASWTLRLGNAGGASNVIANPVGDRTTFDVDE
ncbi:MAG: hypothetical protein ACK2UB_06415 [Anaerolineales bacterium]